jgi:hypothetical protein
LTKPAVTSTKTPQFATKFKPSSSNDIQEPATITTKSPYTDCRPAMGQIYTNSTGHFLVPSIIGNAYMLVLYEYESNCIHVETVKNQTKEEHLAIYSRAIKLFKS